MGAIILTPMQHAVYQWFLDTQDACEECPPGVGDVSVALDLNYGSAYRTLSELCAMELVARTRTNYKGAYTYSLLNPCADVAERAKPTSPNRDDCRYAECTGIAINQAAWMPRYPCLS